MLMNKNNISFSLMISNNAGKKFVNLKNKNYLKASSISARLKPNFNDLTN